MAPEGPSPRGLRGKAGHGQEEDDAPLPDQGCRLKEAEKQAQLHWTI